MSDFKDMGLFNQTVAKVSELEAELAQAHERIRNLEIALKAARVDRARAMGYARRPVESESAKLGRHELNTLSDEEVKRQFELLENDAWMVESGDTADLKSAADNGMPVRSRLWAPAVKFCALFRRSQSQSGKE